MREAETRGETIETSNGSYLSPRSPMSQQVSSHRRSASATPSMRSNISGVTTVGDNKDSLEGDFHIGRQKTFRAEIKLTWWDCLLGLIFGPNKIARKAITTLKTEADGLDEEMYDRKDCPFFVTVSIWPRENPTPERFEKALCIFDTGCLQGNIISLELAHRLGFVDFDPASPRERKGGRSASGHPLAVEGAIHLTWHHSTSSKVFRDMRFLVSSNTECDLVVGARSIQKHKLMSPPNLMVSETSGVTVFTGNSDPHGEELAGIVSQLKGPVKTMERELRKNPNDKDLRQRLEEKQREFKIAELEREEYDNKKEVDKHPNDDNKKKILAETRRELEELTGKHREQNGNANPGQKSNDKPRSATSTEPNGKASGSTSESQPAPDGLRHRLQNSPPN